MSIERKIKLYISTGFANCTHKDEEELPDDWDAMTKTERDEYLQQAAGDFLTRHIDYGAYVE